MGQGQPHARSLPADLVLRSLLWLVLFPGIVAGYIPWRYFGLHWLALDDGNLRQWLALLIIGLGAALLGLCILEFARSGRGTLSPADPPRTLVVQGLYRHVRNPMYLSVSLVLLGEALIAWSAALLGYWAVWFLTVNVFVMTYEEPALRRQFGEDYDRYAARVNRWIPRLTPWRQDR